MAKDPADPKLKPRLKLLSGLTGRPKNFVGTKKSPLDFKPGRFYRNWRMDQVDFLVVKTNFTGPVPQVYGRWQNRRSKNFLGDSPTWVRINIPNDWLILPLATHPRVKLENHPELVREIRQALEDPLEGRPLEMEPETV
jgi:hypothetical protein